MLAKNMSWPIWLLINATILYFCMIVPAVLAAVPQVQRDALVALYNSTDGANWTINTSWLTGDPCADAWVGVECDLSENVSSINLYNNNLVGTIPVELGNLSHLQYLNLKKNQLNGSIPVELGNLTNLQRLDLNTNQLSGSIPVELGNLTNLQYLYLGSNQLNGVIPIELGNLASLEYLIIDFNPIHGSIPVELGNLGNLAGLYLSNSQLSGSIPAELGNLASLRQLYLNKNQLNGSIPIELGNLTNLSRLALGDNQLNGAIPVELSNLSELSGLYLSNNQLSGLIPAELGDLTSLTRLQLEENLLDGSIPTELSKLADLAELNLEQNLLSGSIPPELGMLIKLQDLTLSGNHLTGTIPAELGTLASLWVLNLSGNQLDGTIPTELSNLTGLRHLWLSSNQLSGAIPAVLGNLVNLEWLRLNDNQLSGSIPTELGNLTNLELLWLDKNQLKGAIPDELANLTNLTWLYLSSNQLSGLIPTAIANLSNLGTGFYTPALNLHWNALSTTDASLDAFLDTQSESDWSATQTVAPANIAAENQGGGTAIMSWDPIEYTGDTGRYRVFYSDNPGGPYIDAGVTLDKTETSLSIDGLATDLAYHFTVQTETDVHTDNQNSVMSELSSEVSSAPEYVTESMQFSSAFDFLTEPLESTSFSLLDVNNGFDSTQDAIVTVLDAQTSTSGHLTIISQDASWQDEADDGVFLGLEVFGDFIAEMTVTSMDNLAGHSVGLMVRVPTTNNLDAAGPGQDYITLGTSSGLTQIEWASTDDAMTTTVVEVLGAAVAMGRTNVLEADEIHFRITRNGGELGNGSELSMFYSIGTDSSWIELYDSPLIRLDMDMLELDVGIYQTSGVEAKATVDDFSVRSEKIYKSSFE